MNERCDHCEIDFASMPGWKHEVRTHPSNAVEHIWFGYFVELGIKFAVGVSVRRHPIDDVVANGRPLITWMLKPKNMTSYVSGAAGSVHHGISLMLDAAFVDDRRGLSRLQRWAKSIVDDQARREFEAKKAKAAPVEVETKPIPF